MKNKNNLNLLELVNFVRREKSLKKTDYKKI